MPCCLSSPRSSPGPGLCPLHVGQQLAEHLRHTEGHCGGRACPALLPTLPHNSPVEPHVPSEAWFTDAQLGKTGSPAPEGEVGTWAQPRRPGLTQPVCTGSQAPTLGRLSRLRSGDGHAQPTGCGRDPQGHLLSSPPAGLGFN